ncbi:MAG: DUF4296 domain-containing protein [Ferruginibacter sp.]
MKKANFIIILLFFVSCSQNKIPDGILPPQKMQDVLWDYLRADAFTKEYISKDSTKNLQAENVKLQKNLFSMHHITKEEFYNSYDYYLKHNNKMKVLLDSMIATKTREKLKYMKHLK